MLEEGQKTYQELDLLHKQGVENIDPTTLSGAIRGRRNINNQLDTIFKDAKKSILISTTKEGFFRKADILKSLSKKLKNVEVKIIVPESQEVKDFAKDLKDVKIKFSNGFDSRFALVDGAELLFMVMDDSKVHESYDMGVWVKSPFFVKALENLFEINWRSLK